MLAMYRAHWPRIGAPIAMLVGAATAMAGRRLTKPQILSAANLMALMACAGALPEEIVLHVEAGNATEAMI